MFRNLILIRHAQAADASIDHERPLTAIGERDARYLGRWLKSKYEALDLILHSSALRAKSTAEIIGEELKISSLQEEEELYEASVRTMLDQVNALENDHSTVTIVAHNPTITYFADYLTSTDLPSMSPGSAVVLRFETSGWNEISQNTGTFLEFYSPERPPE